ncbi:MAG: hypothetical protein EA405_02970 [Rhodospirillales bacterium]|nr:MAG: hypothetical protein EA405_02970 [Rhodospirillales bacterium]
MFNIDELRQQALLYVNEAWKRRWIAFIVSIFVAVGGWAFVISMPDMYTSSGRLYVDTRTVLRPLLSGLAVESDVGRELQAMQEMLLSRPNLERLARMTDLDVSVTTNEELDGVLNDLRRRIKMQRSLADIYTLEVSDTEPIRARNTVQGLIDIFVDSNLGRSREDMDSAQAFLSEQLTYYEEQLTAAEQRLAQFKQQNMAFLGRGGYYERLGEAKQELAAAEARFEDAVRERALLHDQLEMVPEMVSTSAGLGPPTDAGLALLQVEGDIRTLRSEREQVLLRYTEQHPDVLALDRRIGALEQRRARLQAADPNPMGGLTGPPGMASENGGARVPNPTYTGLQMRLFDKEAEIGRLEQDLKRRQEQVIQLESSAMMVPEVEAEMARLNRDYGVIKAKHDELLARRETASLTERRSLRGDTVQYRVIDAPQIPADPSWPNRTLFVSAVLVVSLGAGAGGALLLALLNGSFVDLRSLKNHFDLPVLGAISKVEDRLSRHWRMVGTCAFVACFAVFLGAFGSLLVVEREVGLKEASRLMTEARSPTAAISAMSQAFVQER